MEKMQGGNSEEQVKNAVEGVRNPNSIGELLSIGRDLPTHADKVYRSVRDDAAVEDLFTHGAVRNAFSAGAKENSRWGDKIFWSRGEEGKFHVVQKGGYVIEAPYAVAASRVVAKEDVTAIYSKQEEGGVVDVLAQKREVFSGRNNSAADERAQKAQQKNDRLAALKKELGILK